MYNSNILVKNHNDKTILLDVMFADTLAEISPNTCIITCNTIVIRAIKNILTKQNKSFKSQNDNSINCFESNLDLIKDYISKSDFKSIKKISLFAKKAKSSEVSYSIDDARAVLNSLHKFLKHISSKGFDYLPEKNNDSYMLHHEIYLKDDLPSLENTESNIFNKVA